MAIYGIDLEARRNFVSDHDPDKGTPAETRWKIKTLDSRVRGYILDRVQVLSVSDEGEDGQVNTRMSVREAAFQACQFALEGWDNFKDRKGNDIPVKTRKRYIGNCGYDVVDPDIVKLIPVSVQMEVYNAVKNDLEIPEDAEKNSESP